MSDHDSWCTCELVKTSEETFNVITDSMTKLLAIVNVPITLEERKAMVQIAHGLEDQRIKLRKALKRKE